MGRKGEEKKIGRGEGVLCIVDGVGRGEGILNRYL